jgi:hypothetical protein
VSAARVTWVSCDACASQDRSDCWVLVGLGVSMDVSSLYQALIRLILVLVELVIVCTDW